MKTANGDLLRLRCNLIDGPELRCPQCADWLPITAEFWRLNKWEACVACGRERARLYAKIRQRNAEYRAGAVERSRRYRAWLKRVCPEYLPAYERERKAHRRQYQRDRRARIAREREEGQVAA
ncbi:MAG: hypothetical protein ACOYB2_11000 [Limnohabitans sp.]